MIKFYPYGPSNSCRDLARAVGGKRIKPITRYQYRGGDLVVNWGNSVIPSWARWAGVSPMRQVKWLNNPDSVANATNKLRTFMILQSYIPFSIPQWTTSTHQAKQWWEDGEVVYCRTTLQGHGGDGIVIAHREEGLVNAPLYTKKFDCTSEYRVHIFKGQVIDFVKKAKRRGETPNPLIRNHAKGWVFVREGVILPDNVDVLCIRAVELLGLDFGAVDVGYNQETNCICIFEINTACGLQGTTLERYKNAIIQNHYRG